MLEFSFCAFLATDPWSVLVWQKVFVASVHASGWKAHGPFRLSTLNQFRKLQKKKTISSWSESLFFENLENFYILCTKHTMKKLGLLLGVLAVFGIRSTIAGPTARKLTLLSLAISHCVVFSDQAAHFKAEKYIWLWFPNL